MNQKLDVGGTISQIFSTYGAQAGVLLPVAFAIFVVVAIVDAISSGFGMQIVVNLIASTLTAPITALAAATIYFRLLASRAKGEAPDAPLPPAPA
jgi:hypothetical protein